MGMKRFIEGTDRGQSTLFPECLEDWIDENNPVQVIDVFVDELDLAELGFDGITPEATGRPSYHPSVLLKLYIYGYLNRVQSSRRLEREAGRNVEVMWLTGACSRSQDDCRLPQGQWQGHSPGLCPLCRSLPSDGPAGRSERGDRRQQVQGGQQSRQELHAWQGGAAAGAARRECGALSKSARHGRPP